MTGHFTIQWEDNEKELFFIHDETSLFEAIDFYHPADEGSIASSGSLFSSRSSSRHPKITMDVAICIDYDGISLSETSSVASREEDPQEGNELSFLPGELSGSPLDDDAVTISSKDTRAPQAKGRDASLLRKLWTGTSRSAGSSSSSKPSLKPSRSRLFNIGSRASSTEEDTSRGSVRVRLDGRSSASVMDTERPYPGDPSAVLERLRLEERPDPPVLETDRGKAWLQNQKRAMLGVVPSISDDSFSLNTDSPLSDGISLQRDKRGKLYYNLTSVGTSEPADDLEYEVVNGIQPSETQVLRIAPSLNFALYRQRHTPSSRSSGTRRGHRLLRMWEYPRPDQVHLHDLRREDAHVTHCARGSHSGCGKRQESCLPRPSSWE